MGLNYVPTNSVEFETLTTEPTWGDPDEFKTDAYTDDDNKARVVPQHWRILGFLKRDLRLGNLKNSYDDFEYLADSAPLTAAIQHLRNGAFGDLAPLALAPVAATLELSQSRNGFFRKNAKTAHLTNEETANLNDGGGFLGKLFGKNKQQGVN